MGNTINPFDHVVAVVALHESRTPDAGIVDGFLGTAVFCGDPPLLVTADHVLKQHPGPYAIAVITAGAPAIYRAEAVRRDSLTDLAVLSVDGYRPPFGFRVGRLADVKFNLQVTCLEYGTTDTAGAEIYLNPATRVGNVTRMLKSVDFYRKGGEQMLELSFPALKGASGAPVLSVNDDWTVWGIVVANHSRELLSSQIERVYEPNGSMSEEVKFMLPQGLAVNCEHVSRLLDCV